MASRTWIVLRAVVALVAVLRVPPPTARAAGILIEAERWTDRSPDDDTFAVPYADSTASGSAGIARFYLPGHIVYRFACDLPGPADLWVRYAANKEVTLTYSLDSAAPVSRDHAQHTTLPATGGLSGATSLAWGKLQAMDLRTDSHSLAVFSGPLRLDCFWVGQGAPPDPAAMAASALERTRAHLLNPIEPVVPAWLSDADAYRLPSWYDSVRVCAHTRLGWKWSSDNERFLHGGNLLRSIGFQEICRHIKGGGEGAWWPSSVGGVLDAAQSTNYARRIVDEAHTAGCRIIVYYRHMEDEYFADKHPEWTAKDARGQTLVKRGPRLCLNTPYADFVERRLVELARMGADGFLFDETHMPKPFCWCEACQQGFQRETGLAYPLLADPSDPAYQKAIEYKNVVIERVFRRWRLAVHEASPQCVMLIGSNTYPAMNDRHTTHRLYRIADAVKSEFNLPARMGNNTVFAGASDLVMPEADARIALGYAISRDASDGRPPHIWIHNLRDPVSARFATAGVVAHGGVANLDNREASLPDPALFASPVALGNSAASALAGTRPLRWAAVHFSELARDHYLPDERAAWQNVLYPVYGAFTALLRRHCPVGIVTDSQLEQGRLQGYRVLFLSSPEHLSSAMRSAVESFRAGGGLVIEQCRTWKWHQREGGMQAALAAFYEALEPAGPPPFSVEGAAEKLHVVPYSSPDGKRWTIALANDFAWVNTSNAQPPSRVKKPSRAASRRPSEEGEDEGAVGLTAVAAPPACTGIRLVFRPGAEPRKVVSHLSGEKLPLVERDGAGPAVLVPEFECLSIVTCEF